MPGTLPYASALNEAAAALRDAGVEAPRREARLLLAYLIGAPARRLPPANAMVDAAALTACVARRAAHEPLAYITGRAGFWTIDVAVSPATLIPRADSETLIEAALAVFADRRAALQVLDLGTGTGCLLLALLGEYPAAFGIGVDRNEAAARLAARNAGALGLAGRIGVVVADWGAPLAGRFDLVLSNPPYIESGAIAGLMAEVARHEPVLALDGGADGLAAYDALIPALPGLLRPGGCAILELGQGQAPAVIARARRVGFADLATRDDLAGIARALLLHAPAA